MKIKRGDNVLIIAGKDRGKQGEVLRVNPHENRVVVQGLNLRRKHQRARPAAAGRQTAPEIVVFEGQIDASNVMLICPKCGEPTRVAYRAREPGDKPMRQCRHCESIIDA